MPRVTPLGDLAARDPAAAKRRILSALDASRGDMQTAAASLGVSRKQLYNIINDKLRMWRDIESRGYVRHRGPPRVGPIRRALRRLFR